MWCQNNPVKYLKFFFPTLIIWIVIKNCTLFVKKKKKRKKKGTTLQTLLCFHDIIVREITS